MSARAMAALLLAALPASLAAQATAIHRQPLEASDWPGHGLHSVLVRTIIDAGGLVPPHTHPGLELAFVEQGSVDVTIGDAPVRHIAAPGSFQVPARTRHSVRAVGSAAAIVVSTYIVDPAAPIATPAP